MDKKVGGLIAAGLIVILGIYFLATRGGKTSYSTPSPVSTIEPTTTPSSASASQEQVNGVTISSFTFSPATLTVKVGTTVTWTNNDDVPHSIVADPSGADFKSGNFGKGESFSFTFNKVGEFAYHCGVHPSMKAKVVVAK